MKPESDIDKIRHMLDATNEALNFAKGRTIEDLKSSRMLALAIIKDIEILGEAANQVTEDFKSRYNKIPWRAIISTRNRLIHGYFDIDLDVVWSTVKQGLPELAKELKKILKNS